MRSEDRCDVPDERPIANAINGCPHPAIGFMASAKSKLQRVVRLSFGELAVLIISSDIQRNRFKSFAHEAAHKSQLLFGG